MNPPGGSDLGQIVGSIPPSLSGVIDNLLGVAGGVAESAAAKPGDTVTSSDTEPAHRCSSPTGLDGHFNQLSPFTSHSCHFPLQYPLESFNQPTG